MKLLLISSTNNVRNGYGNFTHEYCMELVRRGVDFTLLLPADEQRYDGINYKVEYVLPPYIFDVKTKKILKYISFSYKTDADLIHSFNEFPFVLIAHKISAQNNVPFVVTAHGTYAVKPLLTFFEKYLLQHAYRKTKMIIAVSDFTKKAVLAHTTRIAPVEVVHNGVNLKRFDREVDISSVTGSFANKKILLTTGVLKPRKGQDTVIQALGELRKKRDDFHYVIVGQDDEGGRSKFVAALKKSVHDLGLEKNVTFAGSVSDIELVKYFRACYLYVHTPRIINWNFEGFGIVYLEASACKKPIVAGDSGGIRDAVVHNKTGIVVLADSPSSTADALEKLLNNEDLARTMGEAGYHYAQEHQWDNVVGRYLDLYKKVLQ